MNTEFLSQYTQAAGPHVGDLIWWSLADAAVSRSRLEEIWTLAGLDVGLLPEPATPERSLRLAVREAQVGQQSHLLRLGKASEEELIYAVVEESCDDEGNVTHRQIARVRLARGLGSRLETDAPQHPIVVEVLAAYDRLLHTTTSDDVRRTLVRALASCSALTLREHGGVYWVPAPYAGTVRALRDAVARLGSSRLDVVPVHHSPEAQQALGDAARASLADDIATLRDEVQSFLEEPPERASTLARRLEAFAALRTRARLYQDVLQVQVGDLEAALNALTLRVQGLLQAKPT